MLSCTCCSRRTPVVIRFSPGLASAILQKASVLHRLRGLYGVSVFARDKPDVWPDMSEDEQIESLLSAAELQGIKPETNEKYWFCAYAGTLRSRGFKFLKLDFEGEVPEHYSVDLGTSPDLSTAEVFASAFEPRKRGRPS